jgi:hypothetical protein
MMEGVGNGLTVIGKFSVVLHTETWMFPVPPGPCHMTVTWFDP